MTREEQRAKAAHEYIQSDSVSTGNEVLAFGDFINGAIWADANPQWIPVEERKPNDGQVVFIYTKHGSVSSVTYKDGAFNLNEVLEAINVTHWMPIVPPRKEDKK